jgi:UDP-glucose 4-epimerase
MATIAVTGGSGKLGRAVLERLAAEGHSTISLDQTPPRVDSEDFSRVDFTDYGQALDALLGIDARHSGVDALVHLAAIPGPGRANNIATFHTNMAISFNVFHAARRAGIRKIVYASSETLLGIPFDQDPPYLPVDEEFPARPETIYSLVKHLEEVMLAEFVRWEPQLQVTALRFSNVMEEQDYAAFPAFNADPALRDWNLWSYIDARDGAQAVSRALSRDAAGLEVFNIAAADTVMETPTAELAAARFPEVRLTRGLGTHESLISSQKAAEVLGFVPEHSWREVRVVPAAARG